MIDFKIETKNPF